jgi:hypothetical protein
MTPELILSIVSLVFSTIGSILTIIINIKISKINNLEALHKYNKKISRFELSFKDEAWLVKIMQSGEFSNYDEESKQLIHQWWLEYKNEHEPTEAKSTLPKSKRFSGGRYRLSRKPATTRNKCKED